MMCGSSSAFILAMMRAGNSRAFSVSRSIKLQHAGVQFEGRDQEFFGALKLADSGQQIEQIGRVLAEGRAAGQQADVGVKRAVTGL
jgi:hypothetical protein